MKPPFIETPLTKKDRKEIKQWTDALRSGKYSQTKGQLQNSIGFCCLGVACEIFTPPEQALRRCGTNFLLGEHPSYHRHGLMLLNDSHGYTFTEIADVIDFVIENNLHEVEYENA